MKQIIVELKTEEEFAAYQLGYAQAIVHAARVAEKYPIVDNDFAADDIAAAIRELGKPK